MQFEPKYLREFSDHVLVQCPRCASCAHIRRLYPGDRQRFGYRLLCPACVHEIDWLLERDSNVPIPCYGPKLSGFELDLWLQVPCCGTTLWAYNLAHVAFLEGFVGAELRERRQDASNERSNSSLQSSLPKWMLTSGNRDAVLKALSALRERAVVVA